MRSWVSSASAGRVRFHPLPLATAEVADVLATVVPRIGAWRARHGVSDEDAVAVDAWTEDAATLAGLAVASVRGVAALERLAVLVPRPRVNLILYHGVLGPRAAWRSAVVPTASPPAEDVAARASGTGGSTWAALMRRAFGFDVLACARCGGRLSLVAMIEQAPLIHRILRHLGLPHEVPAARPPRAPPLAYEVDEASAPDASEPVRQPSSCFLAFD